MKVIITKNYAELSKEAFKIMVDVIKNKPNACLGLATGTTPLGLYQELIKDHQENKTSYKKIRTVNLDEYLGLDYSNDQSYAYFMRVNLFDYLDIDLKNTHIENGKALDLEAECQRYNEILKENVPDIQLLGIGSDGHIAFNEPGTSFEMETHVATLAASTIKDNSRLFKDIREVPTKAYTQGPKNIMRAKKILLLASGKNKAQAVYDMLKGPVSENCPASILQRHPNCIVILDEEAAELIK